MSSKVINIIAGAFFLATGVAYPAKATNNVPANTNGAPSLKKSVAPVPSEALTFTRQMGLGLNGRHAGSHRRLLVLQGKATPGAVNWSVTPDSLMLVAGAKATLPVKISDTRGSLKIVGIESAAGVSMQVSRSQVTTDKPGAIAVVAGRKKGVLPIHRHCEDSFGTGAGTIRMDRRRRC